MNKGKVLENLVAEIERILTPSGLSVQVNDKVFDDSGVQIAEFDIVISGNLGSSSIRWLIECRDRPSTGAAPAGWIEQLGGRKLNHGFDRVFAVSTTGYAPGAIEAAQRLGVILRTVKSVSELSSKFQVLYAAQITPIFESIEIVRCTPRNFESSEMSLTLPNPLFKLQGEGNYQTIEYFAPRHFELPEKIDENEVHYFSSLFRGPVEVNSNNQIYIFTDLAFTIKMRLKARQVTTLIESMKSYEEQDRVIGQEVRSSMETPAGKVSAQFTIAHQQDGTHDIKIETSSEALPGWMFSTPKITKKKRKDTE